MLYFLSFFSLFFRGSFIALILQVTLLPYIFLSVSFFPLFSAEETDVRVCDMRYLNSDLMAKDENIYVL